MSSSRLAIRAALVLWSTSCTSPSLPRHSADAVDAADSMASAALGERTVPGLSLVVLQADDTGLARGYGRAEVTRLEPVTATTGFQLGSISKQFLAALVLRLVEEGSLGLDDPVSRHLPHFAGLPPTLRVRHLLSHTSGLREIFTMPEYQAGIEDLSRGPDELTALVAQAPVDFPPGSRWSYSNTNYSILALLVERIEGKPYEQALAARFFVPLDLDSFRHCTPLPQGTGEARGHVLSKEGPVAAAPENMSWTRGDGGLCGNAVDLARWTRLLATGRVITPQSYRLMAAPTRLTTGREAEYGLGLSLVGLDGRRKVAHNGAMLGFSASAAYYPDAELTVVVLVNRGDVRTESIERRIARRFLGLPPPVPQDQPLLPDRRARFVGTYDIGVFAVRVVERGEQLWLETPSPGPTTPLRYLGRGEFVGAADPEAYALTFDLGDGPARELRLLMGAMHWYGTRVP